METFVLHVTVQELNLVLNSLGQRPYVESAGLINKLSQQAQLQQARNQAQPQNGQPQAAGQAPKASAPEPTPEPTPEVPRDFNTNDGGW